MILESEEPSTTNEWLNDLRMVFQSNTSVWRKEGVRDAVSLASSCPYCPLPAAREWEGMLHFQQHLRVGLT